MNIFSGIMVYVLTWWIVFFCMLPIGIRPIERPEGGQMPGAPANPGLGRKVLWTTLVAGVVWLVIYALIRSNLISFHDMAERMPL